MGQLKFDEKGFLQLEKISYKIKHEEDTEEAIKEMELEKELLRGLQVLEAEDRDLRSLTIWCNSNYSRSSDQDLSGIILSILEKLIDGGCVIYETSPNGRSIFSINNSKNVQKKGV